VTAPPAARQAHQVAARVADAPQAVGVVLACSSDVAQAPASGLPVRPPRVHLLGSVDAMERLAEVLEARR
jgi:hypothetical protein